MGDSNAILIDLNFYYRARYGTVIIPSPGSTPGGRLDRRAADGGDFPLKNKVEGLSPSTP